MGGGDAEVSSPHERQPESFCKMRRERNTDSGSLEVIHFRFYQYNGDESDIEPATEETLTRLSQELEAEYGPSTIYDNDLEDMHSTVHHWNRMVAANIPLCTYNTRSSV